jgi:hypothetical protein
MKLTPSQSKFPSVPNLPSPSLPGLPDSSTLPSTEKVAVAMNVNGKMSFVDLNDFNADDIPRDLYDDFKRFRQHFFRHIVENFDPRFVLSCQLPQPEKFFLKDINQILTYKYKNPDFSPAEVKYLNSQSIQCSESNIIILLENICSPKEIISQIETINPEALKELGDEDRNKLVNNLRTKIAVATSEMRLNVSLNADLLKTIRDYQIKNHFNPLDNQKTEDFFPSIPFSEKKYETPQSISEGQKNCKAVFEVLSKNMVNIELKENNEPKPSQFFNELKFEKIESKHHEWHINYAFLSSYLMYLKEHHPDLVKNDDVFHKTITSILARSYKFSGGTYMGKEEGNINFQTNPLQPISDYHRSAKGHLYSKYKNFLSEHSKQYFNLVENNISLYSIPIADKQSYQEIVRDRFGPNSYNLIVDPSQEINDPIFLKHIANSTPYFRRSIFIDIGKALQKITNADQFTQEELASKLPDIVDDIIGRFRQSVTSYVKGNIELDKQDQEIERMMKNIIHHAVFGCPAQIGNQEVFLLMEKHGGDFSSPAFQGTMSSYGHTPGPSSIFEQLAKALSLDESIHLIAPYFKRMEITGFPRSSLNNLKNFSTFSEFINQEAFKKFAEQIELHPDLPYVAHLGKAMLKFIEGLETACGQQYINEKSNDPVLGPLIQYLYNRILSFIENSLQHIDQKNEQQGAFLHNMDMINEELSTLLALLEPYKLSELDLHMPAPPDNSFQCKYELTNGGMHSFTRAFLFANTLAKSSGINKLNVASLNGTYFEEISNLSQSIHYKNSVLESDNLTEYLEKTETYPVNVFIGAFSATINPDAKEYDGKELDQLIRQTLEAQKIQPQKVANPVIWMIDGTITTRKQINSLVTDPKIAEAIKEGHLHLIFPTSLQKFDMFGFDNKNAGSLTIYSANNELYEEYKNNYPPTSLPAHVVQDILHKQAFPDLLNEYRQQITKATDHFFQLLPSHLQGAENKEEFCVILPNKDKHNKTFFHLYSPIQYSEHIPDGMSSKLNFMISYSMKYLLNKLDFEWSERQSFGFNYFNIDEIPLETKHGTEDVFRCTIGMESQEKLNKLRDIFVIINNVGKIATMALANKKTPENNDDDDYDYHEDALDPIKEFCYKSKEIFNSSIDLLEKGLDVQLHSEGGVFRATLKEPIDDSTFASYSAYAKAWGKAGLNEVADAIFQQLQEKKISPSATEDSAPE